MIKLKACLLFLCILGMQLNATAQTIDLFAETPTTVAKDIATGIFKTTRIVNGQSIENSISYSSRFIFTCFCEKTYCHWNHRENTRC